MENLPTQNIYELGFDTKLYKVKPGETDDSGGAIDPSDITPGVSVGLTSGSIVSQGDLATLDTAAIGSTVTGDLDDLGDGTTYKRVSNVDASNNITANSIAANAVTSTKIDVSELSAISANIGSITSGTITGITIQTSASANTGVKLNTGGIDVYGQNTLDFRDTGGTLRGTIWGYTGGHLRITSGGVVQIEGSAINMTTDLFPVGTCSLGGVSVPWNSLYAGSCNLSAVYILSGGTLRAAVDNNVDLGSSSYEFKDLYIDGTANIDSLVADTADINAGTIDATTIGGTTPADAEFDNLTATGDCSLGSSDCSDMNVLGGLTCDSLRIDETATASTTLVASHYVSINCNGTGYKIMLDQ
jgi:hypothetical protein